MSGQTGRNDPCPCGSGKKYKNCCLKSGVACADTAGSTDGDSSDLRLLLGKDSVLREFYRAVESELPSSIRLVPDAGLPAGIDFRVTRDTAGLADVRLRRFPPQIRDSVMIAHELAHLVLEKRGFPALAWRDPSFENVTSALNSMVADPLVLRLLIDHKLDPLLEFKREAKQARRQLGRLRRGPGDPYGRLHWSANVVGRALEAHVLGRKAEAVNRKFLDWFGARFPDMITPSLELQSLVQEVGFDSPGSMRELLTRIITKYGLARHAIIAPRTKL